MNKAPDSIPDVLSFSDGTKVNCISDWQKRREEIKETLQRREYGFFPPEPDSVSYSVEKENNNFCGGNAILRKNILTVNVVGKTFSFPFFSAIPKNIKTPPAFLHINFNSNVPDKYMPTEEITDNGFAVYSFSYKDVTSDDGDFSNGLASLFFEGRERKETDAGKIVLWAWAAMRVMDCIVKENAVNTSRVSVVGHSRLGKTALVTAAFDERFYCGISNDSGCSGAAITRDKDGEHISDITRNFPFWFCPDYAGYSDREDELPFDQHWLIALIAPRPAYVASASEDTWADPEAELLSCELASDAWKIYGLNGLAKPENGISHAGSVGYHLRQGTHYLSRYDWQRFIDFIRGKA